MFSKNKKILLWVIMLPLLGMTSLVKADFNCSTVDQTTVKEVMDKQKAWTTLTTDEQTLLDNLKSCRVWGSWALMGSWARMPRMGSWETMGSGSKMHFGSWEIMWSWAKMPKMGSWETMWSGSRWEKSEDIPDSIKTILEKQKAWTTLKKEEKTALAAWQASKAGDGSGSTNKEAKKTKTSSWTTSSLSDTYKKALDTQVEKIVSQMLSLSTEEQVEKLQAYVTKFTALNTKIQASSSYTSTKKTTYGNILNYVNEKLNDKIDSLSSTSTTSEDDSILDYLTE